MAADTMTMGFQDCIVISLFKIEDQKLLELHWHSLLWGGTNIVNTIFAHNGGQHFDCRFMLLHSSLVIEDARPEIVDGPLTLIFRR